MDEQEYLDNQALLMGSNRKANLHNTLAAVAAMSNNPGAAAAAKLAAADQQRQYSPQKLGNSGYMLPDTGAFVPSKIYQDEKKAAAEEKRSLLSASLAARAEADANRLEAARERAAERSALAMTLAGMRGQSARDIAQMRIDAKGDAVTAPKPGKTLPAPTINKLSDAEGMATGFADLASGFQDVYGGGYGTMGVQNFLGKNVPNSKYADQSNWWQGYNDQKNMIRNKLFGSALTASEKAAFDAANITEGMDPKQIRTKLAQQHAATVRARNKLVQNYGGSGYDVSGFEPMEEPAYVKPGASPQQSSGKVTSALSPAEQAELDKLRKQFGGR